ncbi:membrane protein [Kwoniella heveanensis CBS 569]|uniref:Membrane protein n=1 Tax=Kwoniella heveanensis BCC8398 TaxID=1296120 RepID=A0A1B9H0B9_9TREE|nr:membrane protein [Kwoniella heveanensis BCC8398]OCF43128.1 membrane protein [Kwoniella heveanensis CBS 569]
MYGFTPLSTSISLLIVAGSALATPLQPTFSSCLSSFSPVAQSQNQLNVSNVYASIVSAKEATEQGLVGNGHKVLRVDLVGTVGAEVIGYDNTTNKLATLFTNTKAATFNVYDSTSWLCNSLFPSELPEPYYPYNTTYCPLPAGNFAVNLSIPLYHSYALTTLHTRVRIVDTSLEAANLACIDIQVTPYKRTGWYYRLFLWLPVAVTIGIWAVSWAARFYTGWIVGSGVAEYESKESSALKIAGVGAVNKREIRLRKWGTMIISGLSGERLSVSGGLLRFVTPSLKDLVFHIQFCAMLGMIAVNWPQFAYPIFAREAWAHLVWNTTLVQGANAGADRINPYPSNYTPSPAFASQMNDARYPLYIDANSMNPVIDLRNAPHGMESFALAVGLRPQDLFGTCLSIFLIIVAAVILISLVVWFLHALMEYSSMGSPKHQSSPGPKRTSLGSSPRGSLGGKEAYDPRNPSAYSDNALPTRASLAQQRQASTPSKFRRTWFRFRHKGEAGAFHAAALYGNLLRLILIFHLPITIFSLYQLCLGGRASIVSRVFAAIAFAFISVLIPAFIMFKIYRAPSGKLYDATRTLLSLGPMYNIYVEGKQMFRGFSLLASLVAGVVVGAGQKSGIAQTIIIILIELLMLIVPGAWYPWAEGASMGAPNVFLSMLRLISVVLAMLLSSTIAMTTDARDWIAYAVLILQAITFLFFLFMLLTKIIEGAIRIFGGVHFDESTHPLDGGIFAAIMDLDCLNGVRGGKAAARKRRKRGSRQLQRNVSAAGSLTTQMMLDRHSQGVTRPPVNSEGSTPFLTPGYPAMPMVERQSYFPGYQPPLGPPPPEPERLSSESRSAEGPGDAIMDAWRPSPSTSAGYAPPGAYVPSATSPTYGSYAVNNMPRTSQGGPPGRSFSVVRGGRADFENPYEVLAGPAPARDSPVPIAYGETGMAPHIRVSQVSQRPMSPPHSRQKSSSAIIEVGTPPLVTPPGMPNQPYPSPQAGPSRQPQQGMRANNAGLRPPALAIPKRRSLNDLKNDPSPDSQYSSATRKKHKHTKSGGWFSKNSRSPGGISDGSEESDDEPGPSRRKKNKEIRRKSGLPGAHEYREPLPFEDVPSPDQAEREERGGKGWLRGLGLGRKKSVDEFAKQAQDENKARKAALAAESGALFAGVEAPSSSPGSKKAFVVHRPGPQPLSPTSPPGSSSNYAQASSSFRVKRTVQPVHTPQIVTSPTNPASVHPSPNLGTGNVSGNTSASVTPGSSSGNGNGNSNEEKRGFRVIRPPKFGMTAGGSTPSSVQSTPPTASTAQIGLTPQAGGYPPSAFTPVGAGRDTRTSTDSTRSEGGGGGLAPNRPVRNPMRVSGEIPRE